MKKHINKLLVLGGVLLFIAVSFVSAVYWTRPLKKSEFEYFEQVAQQIYDEDQTLEEVPEGIQIEMNESTITMTSSDGYTGSVEAKLIDGKLEFKRTIRANNIIKG